MLTGERNRTFGVVCQVLQRLSTQQDAAGWRVGCGAAARCMVELEACATRTPPPGRAAAACAAPPHRSHRPVNLKNMLRQIQPDRRNLAHGWLPLCRTKQPASGHVWMAPLCKRSCGAWSRGRLQSCVRPHMRASPSSYFFHVAPSKRERGGAVRFSPKSELSLRQGISLQTSHPAEDVPTTVPHSGRESSRRAAPLCETALSFARPDNDDAPWDPHARRRAAIRA